MEKIDILSLTPEVLGQHLAEMGEPKFRAKQLFFMASPEAGHGIRPNDYTFSPTPAEAERKILYK